MTVSLSETVPSKNEPGRFVQIDALRGIAALWVVLFHWTVRYDELFGHSKEMVFRVPDGRFGVHLFFMISGFVILLTLDKSKSIKDFIFFRCFRLYPTLWISALLTFLFLALFGLPGREVSLRDAALSLTMIGNLLGAKLVDPVYWSLEVELFFYGLMAAIVGLGLRRYLVCILLLLVICNGVLLLLPGSAVTLPKFVKGFRLLFSMRYLHLFLFGIVCYEFSKVRDTRLLLILPVCIAVACLEESLTHSFLTAIIGGLFFVSTQLRVPILESRILLFLGACSYPLYMLHQNLGFLIIRNGYSAGLPGYASLIIASVLIITLSYIVSAYLEHPFNHTLRRWYRAK